MSQVKVKEKESFSKIIVKHVNLEFKSKLELSDIEIEKIDRYLEKNKIANSIFETVDNKLFASSYSVKITVEKLVKVFRDMVSKTIPKMKYEALMELYSCDPYASFEKPQPFAYLLINNKQVKMGQKNIRWTVLNQS